MSDPIRTCVGCRRRQSTQVLVRVGVSGGALTLTHPRLGRGAWLCADDTVRCFDAATAGRRWGRALRVTVDPASLEAVRRQLLARSDESGTDDARH
ncbi:MAG: YlxR family protein [Acidimicrobiales bacterium]